MWKRFLLFSFLFYQCVGKKQDFHLFFRHSNEAIEKLAVSLEDIADPFSTNYGKYLSRIEIDNIIATPESDKQLVRNWLKNYDVNCSAEYADAMRCWAYPMEISRLFGGIPLYYEREYGRWMAKQVPVIPHELEKIIVLVEGITLPSRDFKRIARFGSKNVVDKGSITLEVLRRLYHIPNDTNLDPKMISIGPIEYMGETGFSEEDLMLSQKANGIPANPVPKENIIGNDFGKDIESALDIQMIGQVANGAELYYEDANSWQLSWAVEFYNRKRIPYIISISYGWNERDNCDIVNCGNMTDKEYIARANAEFLKIASRGVSIFVASGDAGSAGRTNEECQRVRAEYVINPVFPGSSQWITSVGATYLVENDANYKYQTPICVELSCANGTEERTTNFAYTGWTSGGGFALWTPRPKWQDKAVESYLRKEGKNNGVVFPDAQYWNKAGRSYPDVSAVGHNLAVQMGGYWMGVDGTSASTPIWAGLTAILNQYQMARGRPRIGYANPLLYKMWETADVEIYQDVLMGNTSCTEAQCCGFPAGFQATKGYDTASGLGTPNLKRIMAWLEKYT